MRIKYNYFICLFLLVNLLISPNIVFSQTINSYPFEQLTKKNGLPSSMVYEITKDKKGFIWMASNDGLVRFDGVNKRIYTHNPLKEKTISGNRIRSLLYDNQDRLWVGTIGQGLNIYNQETDNFITFKAQKNQANALSNNDILCIFQDSKNRIWVGTENGLNLYLPETNNFKNFLPNENDSESIGAKAVLKIFEDSKGNIWIGTWDGGLNLLKPQGNNDFSFLSLKKDNDNPSSINSNHVWNILEDDNNKLWIATFDGGLASFHLPQSDISKLSISDFKFNNFTNLGELTNNRLFSITKDNKGDIWVGTSLGLGIFNPENIDTSGNFFHTILYSNQENNTLPNNEIRHLFFDKDKEIMWVSTFRGVGYHFMSEKKFKTSYSPVEEQGVVAFIESVDKNIQYYGLVSQGLLEYNTVSKSYKRYRHQSNNLNFDRVLCMFEWGEKIWIGSQAGLSVFNKRTKRLQILNYLINNKPNNTFTVSKIFKDSKNRIWLTTNSGLVQTDSSLSTFKLYQPDSKKTNTISDNVVMDIEEDNDGNLWITTCGGGLNKLSFDKKGNHTFQSYCTSSRKNNFPSTDLLIYLELDQENTIWIGSEVGLMKYLIDRDSFINDLSFGRSRIFGLELVEDNLWLSDSEGITKYNIKADRVSRYSVMDGLQKSGFLQYACSYSEKDNILFFGSADGCQIFSPNEILENDNSSPLLITDLMIFNTFISVNEVDNLTGDVILKENILNTKKIELSHLHTSFTLSITPLDFENSARYLYAYKLEGLDKDWQYTTEPEINYSRLPNGNYNFIIKAQNSDGFWSPETTLEIIITPPFWKKTWFLFLTTFLVLSILSSFVFFKIRRVNFEKEQLENLVLDTSTTLSNTVEQSLSPEDILKENKLFFEKLYLESPLGIAFTDGDFKIIKFNENFKNIFKNSMINGKYFFDFIAIEKQKKCLLLVQNSIKKQEKTFRQDIPFTIAGESIWLNTAFSFLYNKENELRYAIIKTSDVTARKTQEKMIQSLVKEVQEKNEELEEKVILRTQDLEISNQELITKNEELARFAYIASHDLKEPLRNISSFVGLINRKAKKEKISSEIREYLDFIKINTHQMHTIISDVLEYSKFDENKFVIETVNLNQIFREIELIISNSLKEKNAKIIVPTLPNIISNRGFLFLLIKNLIENGIKYNENENPTIEVIAIEEAEQFILKIKDNGIGIEPEYHDQIFKMFTRLHNREKYTGSGLGLAVCKKIIEKMGGELDIESQLGQGSTFIIKHPKYHENHKS